MRQQVAQNPLSRPSPSFFPAPLYPLFSFGLSSISIKSSLVMTTLYTTRPPLLPRYSSTSGSGKVPNSSRDIKKMKDGIFAWMESAEREAQKAVDSARAELEKVQQENSAIRENMGQRKSSKTTSGVGDTLGMEFEGTHGSARGWSTKAYDMERTHVPFSVSSEQESWRAELNEATTTLKSFVREIASLKDQISQDAGQIRELKSVYHDELCKLLEIRKQEAEVSRRHSSRFSSIIVPPQDSVHDSSSAPPTPPDSPHAEPLSSPETLVQIPLDRAVSPEPHDDALERNEVTILPVLSRSPVVLSAVPSRPAPTRAIPAPPPLPLPPATSSATIPTINVIPPSPPALPPASTRPRPVRVPVPAVPKVTATSTPTIGNAPPVPKVAGSAHKTAFEKYDRMLEALQQPSSATIRLIDLPWPMLPSPSSLSYPPVIVYRTDIARDRVEAFVKAYCDTGEKGKKSAEKMLKDWKGILGKSSDALLNGTINRTISFLQMALNNF